MRAGEARRTRPGAAGAAGGRCQARRAGGRCAAGGRCQAGGRCAAGAAGQAAPRRGGCGQAWRNQRARAGTAGSRMAPASNNVSGLVPGG